MPSRCAGAPRRPASGSRLSLLIPSWHAVLSDPEEFDIDIQIFDANIGLRRLTSGSALPTLPQSVSARAVDFVASLVRFRYSLPGCSPLAPLYGSRRLERPAFGGFSPTSKAFNGSVSLPVAGYNYNSDWTPLLAGLSPAGMAASLAARSISTGTRPAACSAMAPAHQAEAKSEQWHLS